MLRLVVAGTAPLSADEAYYWVWSRALAAGYYDHPPMVALFIRAGTWLAGDGALGVRLLAPLAAAAGSLLLARAADDLVPGRRAGVAAAALLNASLLLGVGAVTMTPDTPLLLFWTAALAGVARVVATGDGRWFLAAGLAAGLALDSKYTAALLAPALLLWLLIAGRRWLTSPWPYLGAALAVAAFAPVLAWNAAHGWVGIARQGARLADAVPGRAAGYLAELIAGQIGLATPGIAVLLAAGVAASVSREPRRSLLACVTLLPAAVFLQHAIGDRVQANWPSVLYPSASIAAAGLGVRWAGWWRPSVLAGATVTAAVYLQAIVAPIRLPAALDPTLAQLGGWDGLSRAVATSAAQQGAAFVAVDNYGLAAILGRDVPVPVVGIAPRWGSFALPDAAAVLASGPGLLLRPARRTDTPDPRDWATVAPLAELTRARASMTAETYRLYRVTARPGGAPAVLMPRAGEPHAPADP